MKCTKQEMREERKRLIFWREYARVKGRNWDAIDARIKKLDARLGIQEELLQAEAK